MKIQTLRIALACLLMTVIVMSCKKEKEDSEAATPGINLAYMDNTTSPADDFFRYVNGGWLDNTEIPADRSRWGSFDELRQKTDKDALAILDEAMNDYGYGIVNYNTILGGYLTGKYL